MFNMKLTNKRANNPVSVLDKMVGADASQPLSANNPPVAMVDSSMSSGTPREGREGVAIVGNGSASCRLADNYALGQNFEIAGWIKLIPQATQSAVDYLILNSETGTLDASVMIWLYENQRLNVRLFDNSDDFKFLDTELNFDNKFHLLSIRYVNGICTVSINGVTKTKVRSYINRTGTYSSFMDLRTLTSGNPELFDFRFNILDSSGNYVSNLAHYKLDSKSETTIYDSSGNGYNGLIQNYYEGLWGTQNEISYPNDVGYTLSDGATYYYDNGGVNLIPAGEFIPRDESNPTKCAAFLLNGTQADLAFIGSVPPKALLKQSNCFEGNGSGRFGYKTITHSPVGILKIECLVGMKPGGTGHLFSADTGASPRLWQFTSENDNGWAFRWLLDGVVTLNSVVDIRDGSMHYLRAEVDVVTGGVVCYTDNIQTASGTITRTTAITEFAMSFMTRSASFVEILNNGMVCNCKLSDNNGVFAWWPLSESIQDATNHTAFDVIGGNHATLINGSLANNGVVDKPDGDYSMLGLGYGINDSVITPTTFVDTFRFKFKYYVGSTINNARIVTSRISTFNFELYINASGDFAYYCEEKDYILEYQPNVGDIIEFDLITTPTETTTTISYNGGQTPEVYIDSAVSIGAGVVINVLNDSYNGVRGTGFITCMEYYENGVLIFTDIDFGNIQIPASAIDPTKDALGNSLTLIQDGKSFLNTGAKLEHYPMPRVLRNDTDENYYTSFWSGGDGSTRLIGFEEDVENVSVKSTAVSTSNNGPTTFNFVHSIIDGGTVGLTSGKAYLTRGSASVIDGDTLQSSDFSVYTGQYHIGFRVVAANTFFYYPLELGGTQINFSSIDSATFIVTNFYTYSSAPQSLVESRADQDGFTGTYMRATPFDIYDGRFSWILPVPDLFKEVRYSFKYRASTSVTVDFIDATLSNNQKYGQITLPSNTGDPVEVLFTAVSRGNNSSNITRAGIGSGVSDWLDIQDFKIEYVTRNMAISGNFADKVFSNTSETNKVKNIRTHKAPLIGKQLETEKRITNNL